MTRQARGACCVPFASQASLSAWAAAVWASRAATSAWPRRWVGWCGDGWWFGLKGTCVFWALAWGRLGRTFPANLGIQKVYGGSSI